MHTVRFSQFQCMLGSQLPPQCILGSQLPPQCILGSQPLPSVYWETNSPVNRMTHMCKNITLPQTLFAGGYYVRFLNFIVHMMYFNLVTIFLLMDGTLDKYVSLQNNYQHMTLQTFVHNSILLTGFKLNYTVHDFLCPLHCFLIDFNAIRNCIQKFALVICKILALFVSVLDV